MIIKIFLLICTECFIFNQMKQESSLPSLLIKDEKVKEILREPLDNERKYESPENRILLFIITETETGKEIRLGAIDKKISNIYLSKNKRKPTGFFDYQDFMIIVFGQDTNLFEQTGHKRNISFLENDTQLNTKKEEFPSPPLIYEPFVWVYSYKNNHFELVDVGRFELLN